MPRALCSVHFGGGLRVVGFASVGEGLQSFKGTSDSKMLTYHYNKRNTGNELRSALACRKRPGPS